jgi:S-adenosylmethionine synthetase
MEIALKAAAYDVEPTPGAGGTSFMRMPQFFFTSESVTEGHPDKVADAISDAILDAHLREDPDARVACETIVKTGLVIIVGEITSKAGVDYQAVARDTIRAIGYLDASTGFHADACGIIVSLERQSPDIALGVDRAAEFKRGEMQAGDVPEVGAGDQGMMIGFACTETPELMPLPISLAHRLTRRLAAVRKEGILPYLRPDGKSQVTVEYAFGRPHRIDTILLLTQHDPSVSQREIKEDLEREVVSAVLPDELLDEDTKYYCNTTGRFVIGGPLGDAGLTGRKILVDTYGGMARHGGGAFSGKDPTKVDRSGAYAARYIAKNVVAAGLASRFEIQISYAVGMAAPLSVSFETFGTHTVPELAIEHAIREVFDLRPGAVIDQLGLQRPLYLPVASYGHFGRDDLDVPWERLDRVSELRDASGRRTRTRIGIE